MENDSKTELIDRYLDNEMPGAEKYSFENQLLQDADLRLEVEAQRAVRSLIRERAEKDKLRNLFNSFQKEMVEDVRQEVKEIPIIQLDKKKKKDLKVNWGNWSYMAIAASVTLTIIGIWTFLKQGDQIGDQVEVRQEKKAETFRVPLLFWKSENFKPKLQDRQQIDVSILRSKGYKSHYRFTHVLEIYSDTLTEKQQKISVAYDLDTRQYLLHIGNVSYPIKKSENVIPLPQPK